MENKNSKFAERDAEIVRLVHSGIDRKQVALQLGCSTTVVDNAMAQYASDYETMRAHNRRHEKHVAKHPCRIPKYLWPTCYGIGCYHKKVCDAWRSRALVQTITIIA